jgi:hypothetical protein
LVLPTFDFGLWRQIAAITQLAADFTLIQRASRLLLKVFLAARQLHGRLRYPGVAMAVPALFVNNPRNYVFIEGIDPLPTPGLVGSAG